MRIEEFIRHILESMPDSEWSQMRRAELVYLATELRVQDPWLCADVCLALGIGERYQDERPMEVVFRFERPAGEE